MAISTVDAKENTSGTTEVNVADDADVSIQPDQAAVENVTDEVKASEDDSAVPEDAATSTNILPEAEILENALEHPVDAETPEPEHIHGHMEPVRTEEVEALLSESENTDEEESEIVSGQNTVEDVVAPDDDVQTEIEADKELTVADSFYDLPDNLQKPTIYVEPGNSDEGHSASSTELKNILDSLQDSLANTQNISSKIDELSNDTDRFAKQLNGVSINCELLSAEMESFTSSDNTKNMLSKSFLIISSTSLALLIMFQIYMFASQIKTQRLLNVTGSSVLQNISGLNKKIAVYDNHLSKALESQAQQEHARTNPAAAEKTGHETAGNKDGTSATVTPVLEKLNKLRNGLPEKKLIRKETGDWFVLNMKNEESISDVEVIEVLNQSYRRIGRSLTTNVPMPSNNALCILKPDGRGGTEVVMTNDFLPSNDPKPEPRKKHK
jgi:hypothetical protein